MNTIASKALGNAGASVRALNPHLFGQLPPKDNPQVECAKSKGKPLCEVFAAEAGKRVRQSAKPLMNKLETEWLRVLLIEHQGEVIWTQALRWRLGNGIWYKPDFAAHLTQGFRNGMTCWEVKGPHAFRGGFENLKVAASLYPEVRWVLVWKKDGHWQRQEILP